MYEYYKSVVENDIIDIFVIGNIDVKQIEEILDEYIPKTIRIKDNLSHYVIENNRNSEQELKEKLDIMQSNIAMGLSITDVTDFEKKYVMNMYTYILGGSGDSKLFKNVREKESLCYSIGSSPHPLYGIITINAGINNKDYEKAIELIKEQIESMADGNFSEEDVKKGIITYINSCKEINDSPIAIINNYISHEYLNTDLLEERMEQIKKVTKQDIIDLAKKVKINTIFLVEGGNENEEDTSL